MSLSDWDRVSRDDPAYKACLVVSTAAGSIIGGATGSVIGPVGTVGGYLGGAAWGFALGYLACPYVAPAVKRKIEGSLELTDAEVRSASETMAMYASVHRAADAVKLVALVKGLVPHAATNVVPACQNPADTAKQLLV